MSFKRGLSEGLLSCVGVAMASVGHIGEGGHDHDRNDHRATEESNVRKTVDKRRAEECGPNQFNSDPGDDADPSMMPLCSWCFS